ncbi:MarR family transcriptional regulator [Aureimonas sp. ME7]|uniref:MarR family winged helix-turn-helix transcriptional regulator n=1 Tax=Aureimonas sp. ME7 TaxID=2744252 RepID=UPI0015F8F941|nr:MarR family transcriptional regulator [Aureimonas sp. ME7]
MSRYQMQGTAMTIETAEPSLDDAPLVRVLASLSTLSRVLRQHWLTSVDVDPGQDMLLDRLDADKPIGISDLAEQLQVRPSTVSKMVDRLAAKGWCERTALGADRRKTFVCLTKHGMRKRDEVRQVFVQGEEELARLIQHGSMPDMLAHMENVNRALRQRVDRVR